MKKGVLILSGGLDSSVLLAYLCREKKYEMRAISFDYGQKHRRELECARFQAEYFSVPLKIIPLPFFSDICESALLQSGGTIPHGHYREESMKATVVPNRNMIFLSVATAYAAAQKYDFVAYGAHAGDHAIYPDCRPEFIQKISEAIALCDWKKIQLIAPFAHLQKKAIVDLGKKLGVNFQKTWTCYKGGENPCGKCGSCVERKEAFDEK